MSLLTSLLVLTPSILLTSGIFISEPTFEFDAVLKNKITQLLIEQKFPEFETALQQLLGSPQAEELRLKASYESAMHEVLQCLKKDFVVLEERLASHVLIPQCSCQPPVSFILEYRVLRNVKYKSPVQDKLKRLAEEAFKKINVNNYALFVEAFHHVKDIVKVGIAFYNRTSTALVYEVQHVNEQ